MPSGPTFTSVRARARACVLMRILSIFVSTLIPPVMKQAYRVKIRESLTGLEP